MFLSGVVLAAGSWAGNVRADAKKQPFDEEKELVKLCKEAYKRCLLAEKHGKLRGFTGEKICLWSRRWLEAELAVSLKKSDRVAAYKAHLKRMQELEKVAKNAKEIDVLSSIDAYHNVKYHRLQAEIWLRQAQSKK
jgi:hypothetical protein